LRPGENSGSLFDTVDARANLAGSNKMEILLFSLGTQEIFGINVFKVKEVCRTMPITKTPNMPTGVDGIVSLRGTSFRCSPWPSSWAGWASVADTEHHDGGRI